MSIVSEVVFSIVSEVVFSIVSEVIFSIVSEVVLSIISEVVLSIVSEVVLSIVTEVAFSIVSEVVLSIHYMSSSLVLIIPNGYESVYKSTLLFIQGPAPLSKQEVEQLLKKGAYGALMEDDQAGDQFCEEDIDQILQRRTQVITIESVGKGSTFAKV